MALDETNNNPPQPHPPSSSSTNTTQQQQAPPPSNQETLITTIQTPVLHPKATTVRWEIASVEQLLYNRLSTEVDFGWPDSKIEYYGNRLKDPPQEINIKRTRNLFDDPRSPSQQDHEYEISLYLRPSTDMEVTWSLTVSSGENVSVERRIFHKMRAAIASHKFGPCASFRLGDLGQVGQLIQTTNRMRIKVELGIVAERVDSRRTIVLPGPSLPSAISALRDCEELRELCDVDLVANDESTFAAHRLLLSARSAVFRAMFRHGMTETRTGRILIDASPCAVQQFLHFIYTDQIPNVTSSEEEEEEAEDAENHVLTELFEMGARYELPRLQSLAEKQLQETLTIDNVAQRLVMAVRHSSKLLEGPCLSMVKGNITEVMKTEGWRLVANDSSVMAALVCHKQQQQQQEEKEDVVEEGLGGEDDDDHDGGGSGDYESGVFKRQRLT